MDEQVMILVESKTDVDSINAKLVEGFRVYNVYSVQGIGEMFLLGRYNPVNLTANNSVIEVDSSTPTLGASIGRRF